MDFKNRFTSAIMANFAGLATFNASIQAKYVSAAGFRSIIGYSLSIASIAALLTSIIMLYEKDFWKKEKFLSDNTKKRKWIAIATIAAGLLASVGFFIFLSSTPQMNVRTVVQLINFGLFWVSEILILARLI